MSGIARIVGLFVAGLLGLATNQARAQEKVALVIIPIVDTLPMFVALDQGFFARHGIDASIIPAANQSIVMSAIVSGSAQIGTAVAPSMLQAREAGIDTVILWDAASFPYPQPLHVGLIARTGSNINAARDLVGRKVAVIGVNGYHYTLVNRWLTEKGVDPTKVNFAEIPFPQMGDVMRGGNVDAVVSIDPFYSRILDNKVGYVFDNFVATVPDGALIDFYVAERGWAMAHKATIATMRTALTEAIAFIKTNDATSREILAKSTRQSNDLVAHTSLPDYKVDITPNQVEFWLDLAKTQGLITQTYDPASFVYTP